MANTTPNPNGAATPQDPANSDAAALVADAANAAGDPATGTPPTTPGTKASPGSGNDKQSDDSGSSTDNDATASTQSQPAVNPLQLVAAPIAVTDTSQSTPATAGGSASGTTIGETGKPRTKISLPQFDDQDPSPAQDTANAATTNQTATDNKSTVAANTQSAAANIQSGSTGNTANGQASSADPQQPTQPGTDNGANASTQASANLSANNEHVTAQTDAQSATPSADTIRTPGSQTGANTTTDANSLSNLGISATSAANAVNTSAATSGAAATPAVPISGLAVTIAARAQAGSNQFDIRLDPPELGRIDVRLDVDSNGQVTSHVTVDRADTLQLLQSQQPQLERALEQAGLKTTDNGLQFTLRDQSFAGQNNGGNNSGQSSTAQQLVIPDSDLPVVDTTQIYSRYNLGSGIDIRV